MHFYAFLCESVFGRIPAAIRLMYLKSGEVITATPSDTVHAVHDHTHERRLEGGGHGLRARRLPPTPSTLCNFCAYQRWCPEFGGDPALAGDEAPLVLADMLGPELQSQSATS